MLIETHMYCVLAYNSAVHSIWCLRWKLCGFGSSSKCQFEGFMKIEFFWIEKSLKNLWKKKKQWQLNSRVQSLMIFISLSEPELEAYFEYVICLVIGLKRGMISWSMAHKEIIAIYRCSFRMRQSANPLCLPKYLFAWLQLPLGSNSENKCSPGIHVKSCC